MPQRMRLRADALGVFWIARTDVTYLDINCLNCGPFRHQGKKNLKRCPQCGTFQVVVAPHDFKIDGRFRAEKRADNDDE